MAKEWEYAQLAKDVSKAGGRGNYDNNLVLKGEVKTICYVGVGVALWEFAKWLWKKCTRKEDRMTPIDESADIATEEKAE